MLNKKSYLQQASNCMMPLETFENHCNIIMKTSNMLTGKPMTKGQLTRGTIAM
jgi:hypothetical protein